MEAKTKPKLLMAVLAASYQPVQNIAVLMNVGYYQNYLSTIHRF
jgi:hypothetical protein